MGRRSRRSSSATGMRPFRRRSIGPMPERSRPAGPVGWLGTTGVRSWATKACSHAFSGTRSGCCGQRSVELYATRFSGVTMPGWHWLLLRSEREAGGPVAGLVLARYMPGQAALDVVDVIWDQARLSAASVMHAVARAARADGLQKLSLFTLAESHLARCLERCGFVRRPDTLPLVLHLMRQNVALPPAQDWLLTSFDGSAW